MSKIYKTIQWFKFKKIKHNGIRWMKHQLLPVTGGSCNYVNAVASVGNYLGAMIVWYWCWWLRRAQALESKPIWSEANSDTTGCVFIFVLTCQSTGLPCPPHYPLHQWASPTIFSELASESEHSGLILTMLFSKHNLSMFDSWLPHLTCCATFGEPFNHSDFQSYLRQWT